MHIQAEPREAYTILHLRGEFDTYYCPLLQKEIDSLVAAGVHRVVLNLRLVKFINSTALGAIIKASKQLDKLGGKLALSRPSPFVREIVEKVGLSRVVGIYEDDDKAGEALVGDPANAPAGSGEDALDDEAAVLFSLKDKARVEHFLGKVASKNPVHGHAFGKNWRGIGRMAALDTDGLAFYWGGGNTGLSPFEMGQLLALGTELQVKFRLPLLKKGHCEATVSVTSLEERDENVRVAANFGDLDDETRKLVSQYAQDMAFLKKELRRATGGEASA